MDIQNELNLVSVKPMGVLYRDDGWTKLKVSIHQASIDIDKGSYYYKGLYVYQNNTSKEFHLIGFELDIQYDEDRRTCKAIYTVEKDNTKELAPMELHNLLKGMQSFKNGGMETYTVIADSIGMRGAFGNSF